MQAVLQPPVVGGSPGGSSGAGSPDAKRPKLDADAEARLQKRKNFAERLGVESSSAQYNVDHGNVLGAGGFAKVVMGKDILSGKVVAVKVISVAVEEMDADDFLYAHSEVAIMRQLRRHPNIVSLLSSWVGDEVRACASVAPCYIWWNYYKS